MVNFALASEIEEKYRGYPYSVEITHANSVLDQFPFASTLVDVLEMPTSAFASTYFLDKLRSRNIVSVEFPDHSLLVRGILQAFINLHTEEEHTQFSEKYSSGTSPEQLLAQWFLYMVKKLVPDEFRRPETIDPEVALEVFKEKYPDLSQAESGQYNKQYIKDRRLTGIARFVGNKLAHELGVKLLTHQGLVENPYWRRYLVERTTGSYEGFVKADGTLLLSQKNSFNVTSYAYWVIDLFNAPLEGLDEELAKLGYSKSQNFEDERAPFGSKRYYQILEAVGRVRERKKR